MLKKILTLCLVLCMVSLPAFAALEDIAGEKFEKEISLLNSIGIVEGKEANAYKPADKLTRAEMVTIVLRLMSVDASIPATFEDVAADHWGSKYIGTAAQLGIVNGMSATTFAPDENVTYPQAAKMLVCTLGYGVAAEEMGGWPTGYLAVASQLGVLKSTSDDGQPISRAVMAKMVANSLDVDLMVRTGFGSEFTYEPKEGTNLLNKYLGISVIEGTIDANYTLNLGGAACEENEVAMGNTVIAVGDTNIASFLGREVTVYAKEDEEEEVLTALYVQANKNSEIFTIDAEDILPQTSATELWYDVDGNKEFIAIDAEATWVYNGGKVDADVELLTKGNASITLSANDGEIADIVFVNAYQDAVVHKVNASKGLITFKTPILAADDSEIPTITLDETNKSVKFSITDKDGNAVAISDLNEWDVLTITMNNEQTLYQIVRSNESVTGKITEYSATEETAVISGTSYDIANKLVTDYKTIKNTAANIEAKFYINYLGEVVAADTEGIKEYKYGYLVTYGISQGIDAKESVKIFTEDGEMKVFNLSTKFKKSDKIDLEEQYLLQYKLNAAGEVTELKYMEPTLPPENSVFIGDPVMAFAWEYKVLETTKIFVVPEEYTGNDSLFGFFDHALLSNHAVVPNVSFYDLDEDKNIGVALSKGNVANPDHIGIITKVSEAVNDNDETVTRVSLIEPRIGKKSIDLVEGKTSIRYSQAAFTNEKTLPDRPFEDDGFTPKAVMEFEGGINALEVGDVIYFANNSAEGVSPAVQVINRAWHQPLTNAAFSTEGPDKTYCDLKWNTERPRRFAFVNKIDKITKTDVVFSLDGVLCKADLGIMAEETVLVYDMAKGTINYITPEELTEDDVLFIGTYALKPALTVAYRNIPESAKAEESTELIPNGDFEDDFDAATNLPASSWMIGWKKSDGVKGTQVTSDNGVAPAVEGSTKFFKMEYDAEVGGDSDYTIAYKIPSVSLEDGKTYTFEYYVNCPAGNANQNIIIGVKNAVTSRGGDIIAGSYKNNKTMPTDGWVKETHTFTYDSTKTWYVVLAILNAGKDVDGVAYIDELKIYEAQAE